VRFTVISVAYPFAPVGIDSIGGAEQILSLLDRELVRRGHRSIVVACEGSKTAGMLLATPAADGVLTEEERSKIQRQHRRTLERALELHPDADLVHMHGIDFDKYLPPPGVPVLVTLHLPASWYSPQVFEIARPQTHLHCVSASQQRACPAGTPLLDDIPNGVPVDELSFRCGKRRYVIALGRICPEKNFHVAMDAATRAGFPLILGGEVFPYPSHLEYFRRQIVPRLTSGHRFLGPLGFARKRRLLSGARCLLNPSLAPETSSLVAMESLACGTPVVAFPSGALPDIIDHGVTGFVVRHEQEMADAVDAAGALDPESCRATARRRFSLEAMVQRYLDSYQQMITASPPPPPPDFYHGGQHATLC